MFGEIFTTITMLDRLTIIEVNGHKKSWHEHVFKKKLKFVMHLHTIGEAGTVKITNDTTPKLQDRDVVWLHRMFYEKCNNNSELNTNNISVGNWNNNSNGDL